MLNILDIALIISYIVVDLSIKHKHNKNTGVIMKEKIKARLTLDNKMIAVGMRSKFAPVESVEDNYRVIYWLNIKQKLKAVLME